MTRAIIWTKDLCSYCTAAKTLMNNKGINFEERKIGGGYTKAQLLESVPTAKTVPQIFLDGNYVGGYTELKALLES
jgi:glutaredoxin 3